MKPSWDDAPEWANWLAVDGDGCWYWYEEKPVWEDHSESWREESENGRIKEAHMPISADQSLEPRP